MDLEEHQILHIILFAGIGSYLWSNRIRRPRLVSARRDRRKVRPELSGRGALAAARPRSRCVLSDGCPVVRVHLSFGLALHTGHRTDIIRFCESCPVSTFHSVHHRDFRRWSILLFSPPLDVSAPKWESMGELSSAGASAKMFTEPGRANRAILTRNTIQKVLVSDEISSAWGPNMKTRYLHLSAYPCDTCAGPVIAGSTAVRESEISKETEIRRVGAICLTCGHRQDKATEPTRARHLLPIAW